MFGFRSEMGWESQLNPSWIEILVSKSQTSSSGYDYDYVESGYVWVDHCLIQGSQGHSSKCSSLFFTAAICHMFSAFFKDSWCSEWFQHGSLRTSATFVTSNVRPWMASNQAVVDSVTAYQPYQTCGLDSPQKVKFVGGCWWLPTDHFLHVEKTWPMCRWFFTILPFKSEDFHMLPSGKLT